MMMKKCRSIWPRDSFAGAFNNFSDRAGGVVRQTTAFAIRGRLGGRDSLSIFSMAQREINVG